MPRRNLYLYNPVDGDALMQVGVLWVGGQLPYCLGPHVAQCLSAFRVFATKQSWGNEVCFSCAAYCLWCSYAKTRPSAKFYIQQFLARLLRKTTRQTSGKPRQTSSNSTVSNAALAIITANIRQQPAAAAWGIGFIAFRSKPGACQCNAIHIKQGGCPCTFYELQVLSWLWSCG